MNALTLDFSRFEIRLEQRNEGIFIFDPIREKWVILTPEEEVRQWLINYLVVEKGYPLKGIGIERKLMYHGKPKRFDMLVFGNSGMPLMLIELKRPGIGIGQRVLDQIAQYNHILNVPYLCVFNGHNLIVCRKDSSVEKYQYLSEIPDYGSLTI